MTSLGAVQPLSVPGQVDGDVPRVEHLPGQPGHDLDRVRPADADRAGAQAAGVGRVRVGADDQLAREGVVLQHHLVDDAGPRPPEADAVLGGGRAQEVVDLLVLVERRAEVALALDARLDEVVAVDRGGHGDRVAPGLHELEHGRLPQHVLQDHPVGAELQVALAGLHLLVLGVVQVSEQDLVGQGEGPAQPAAHAARASASSSRRPWRPVQASIRSSPCVLPTTRRSHAHSAITRSCGSGSAVAPIGMVAILPGVSNRSGRPRRAARPASALLYPAAVSAHGGGAERDRRPRHRRPDPRRRRRRSLRGAARRRRAPGAAT